MTTTDPRYPLTGQVVVVTGAGAGIGRAVALAMHDAGADVVAADIRVPDAETTVGLGAGLSRMIGVEVDCSSSASVEGLFSATAAEFGGVDVLVNCAGITRTAEFLDVTEADWDAINAVNAKGTFLCMQSAARRMIAQDRSGRIINIGSIAGLGYSRTSSIAYAATKGAVLTMTKVLAVQLAPHGITVNAINPGSTLTALMRGIVRDRAHDRGVAQDVVMSELVSDIPLNRAIEPEEVAAVAVHLASPASRAVTGQMINVDGGQYVR